MHLRRVSQSTAIFRLLRVCMSPMRSGQMCRHEPFRHQRLTRRILLRDRRPWVQANKARDCADKAGDNFSFVQRQLCQRGACLI